jgi:G3E family GTPase
MEALDLCVLTGFLGSGKTTLLKAFLDSPAGFGTAVIVNEAGEVGLDGALLGEGRGRGAITMLSNGCVCCVAGGDLTFTIEDLLATLEVPPSRIILETSGLSKPGAILRGLQLRPMLPLRVRVVSTFDCVRHDAVSAFEEAAAQWAAAQALVLTRQDLASTARVVAAAAMARAVNPLAVVIDDADRAAAFARALQPGGAATEAVDVGSAHPRITAFFARQTGAMDWGDLAARLDLLGAQLGERLLRVKGLVRLDGDAHPTLVQAVGTLFSPPRLFPGEAVGMGLTIITRDTPLQELKDLVGPPFAVSAPSPFGGKKRIPAASFRRTANG